MTSCDKKMVSCSSPPPRSPHTHTYTHTLPCSLVKAAGCCWNFKCKFRILSELQLKHLFWNFTKQMNLLKNLLHWLTERMIIFMWSHKRSVRCSWTFSPFNVLLPLKNPALKQKQNFLYWTCLRQRDCHSKIHTDVFLEFANATVPSYGSFVYKFQKLFSAFIYSSIS